MGETFFFRKITERNKNHTHLKQSRNIHLIAIGKNNGFLFILWGFVTPQRLSRFCTFSFKSARVRSAATKLPRKTRSGSTDKFHLGLLYSLFSTTLWQNFVVAEFSFFVRCSRDETPELAHPKLVSCKLCE